MATLTKKYWKIKPEKDTKAIDALAKELKIPRIIAKLLVERGVYTREQAYDFFNPNYVQLHNPFLLKDMDKAIDRINNAISLNEKILIYGDYDVDGTTAVALLYSFLKKRYNNLLYYVPDRYSEGYGISLKAIDFAKENNVKLIIALDCGIKENDKIKYALEKNIDFIICDHHLPGNELPPAYAVLDPKRPDCSYPDKELSGCGIGFKLLQAFCHRNYNDLFPAELKNYIDLVSVSVAADIVPITGENRVIVYYGLKKLNENPLLGLKVLKKVAGLENTVLNVNDIVFKIGPRINAAGRIEHGSKAVELLISNKEEEALKYAKEIDKCNNARKNFDEKICEEAKAMILNNELYKRRTIVVYKENWHKGVIGIVASRIAEEFYRPTIVMTFHNGYYVGSARSIENFDLYSAIEQCSEYLVNYGGHTYAAGMTVSKENLFNFINKFEEVARSLLKDEDIEPFIEVDGILNFNEIDKKFYNLLNRFEPYGPGNNRPIFITKNVKDTGRGRAVGYENKHLKLELVQKNNCEYFFPAVAFNFGKYATSLAEYSEFNICYSIDRNFYNNKEELQIRIRDFEIPELED
ncbi:MAG: single-stranded-DNA-specific exonuclease RecJ [Bacteroidales bacterium]|nr:single-stranded-DNA-specific exonuclease RecJ [Bacteroidales bacterium]